MKNIPLTILVFLAIFILNLPTAQGVFAASKKVPVKATTKVVKTPKKVVVQKKVLGTKKGKVVYTYSYSAVSTLVDCHMPDGKTLKTSKELCDNVSNFWNSHKSGGSSGGNSGGSSSNNNGGGSSSNNNPGPSYPATISKAEIMPCGSSSCGSYKTIRVTGTKFAGDSRFELLSGSKHAGQNTNYYNSPRDAVLVGGNGSTEIIMDFYNLPKCTEFDVQVVGGGNVIAKNSSVKVVTPCI